MTYSQLVRTYPNQLSYGLLHFFFSSLGQTFLISLFVASFTDALDISRMQFSWIYSTATLVSALILPLAGKYLDQVKVRYVSLTVAVILIIFSLLTASMQHIAVMALALFGLRFCGQGLMILVGSTATARYFDVGRGKALSLAGLGISIGEFVFPFLVTLMLLNVGWRLSWIFLAVLVVLIFIPAIIWLIPLSHVYQLPSLGGHTLKPMLEEQNPEASLQAPLSASNNQNGEPSHPEKKDASRKEVIRDPNFYLLALVNLWVAFFTTGVFIHQSTIASYNGWSLSLMASCISLFGLTRIISNLFLGPVIDKYTATKSFRFVLIPLILGSLLLILSQSAVAAIIFFLLCGISASLSSLTTNAMWAEVYGTTHLGAIRSLVSTFMVLAAAIAPVIVGWGVSQENWMSPTWIIMIVLMSGSTVIAFVVVKRLLNHSK